MYCFAKWWLIQCNCVFHFELWEMDSPTKSYANLSNSQARTGRIFFLQRRTIYCYKPPDLPIALVAILFYSNIISTYILKEIWDVAFFYLFWQMQMSRNDHVAFGCHAQQVCSFCHFCFWLLASDKLQKYTNHNWYWIFDIWLLSNTNVRNQSGGMWMPHTVQLAVSFCFWFFVRKSEKHEIKRKLATWWGLIKEIFLIVSF